MLSEDFSEERRVSLNQSSSFESREGRACTKMGAGACVEVETLLGGAETVDEANGIN